MKIQVGDKQAEHTGIELAVWFTARMGWFIPKGGNQTMPLLDRTTPPPVLTAPFWELEPLSFGSFPMCVIAGERTKGSLPLSI